MPAANYSSLNDDALATIGEQVTRSYSRTPWVGRDENGRPIFGSSADEYIRRTRRWIQQVTEDSRVKSGQDPEVRNLPRYVDLIMGKHWMGAAPSWRRRPVVNKLARHFWDNLANTADLRFFMDVVTNSSDSNDRDISKTLTTLCQGNFEATDSMASVLFTAMYASLGIGFTKVTRNRVKNVVDCTPLGPDSVTPIMGNPFDLQQSGGLIQHGMKPMSWYQLYHPQLAHLIRPSRPPADVYSNQDGGALGGITYQGWTRGQGQFGVSSLMNASADQFSIMAFATEEGSPYREYHFRDPQLNLSNQPIIMGQGNWTYRVPPRGRVYPWGRTITTAGDAEPIILWDGPNMHWHGMFPYAALRLSPVFWNWAGLSDLRDLVSINNSMNRILGEAIGLVEQACKPTVVTKEGSFAAEEWNNYFPGVPGGKLKLLNKLDTIANQIMFVNPPTGALGAAATFYEILDRAFAAQSGQGYGSKMVSKKQMPSEGAAQAIQESEQGRYRVKGIFTELYFKQLGRLLMSDLAQFKDLEHAVAVLGEDGDTWTYLDQDPAYKMYRHAAQQVQAGGFEEGHKFVSKFNVAMTVGSALPAKRREEANLALALDARGKISGKTLYKKLAASGAAMGNWDNERQEIKQDHEILGMPKPPGKRQVAGAQAPPQ